MLTHLTDSEDKVYALSLGTDKLSEYPIVNVPAMLTLPNLYEVNLPLAVGCILLVVTVSRNLLVLTAQPLLPSLAKRLQLAAIVCALCALCVRSLLREHVFREKVMCRLYSN